MDPANHSSILWQLWNPAAASAAGGKEPAAWFENILLYAEILLVLIFLPIVAGMLYLLNRHMFNSRKPVREDLHTTHDPGESR